MKYLIDECLHTSLVEVAIRAGFTATHVNFLGWSATPDWRLMNRVMQEDFTLVGSDSQQSQWGDCQSPAG